MIYVIVIMVGLLAASSGYGWFQHEELTVAKSKVTTLETQISSQNKAVEATKAEGDKRVAQATKGVAAAATVTKAAVDEAARLRELQKGGTPAGACPAGMAVAELRKGMK